MIHSVIFWKDYEYNKCFEDSFVVLVVAVLVPENAKYHHHQ